MLPSICSLHNYTEGFEAQGKEGECPGKKTYSFALRCFIFKNKSALQIDIKECIWY